MMKNCFQHSSWLQRHLWLLESVGGPQVKTIQFGQAMLIII